MQYDHYQYLYPPRPENVVPRGSFNFYESQGYVAQIKKNGTNTVIFAKGQEVIFKTRHDDNHKAWSPTPEIIDFFKSDSTTWNVFCAELLHSKVSGIRHQLYIYDQIVDDGVHLVGSTFEERSLNLQARWVGKDEGDQIRVHPNVSVAKNFEGNFNELFENLKAEDEGLVLKKATGRLKVCFKADANAGWQVKSRIPHKNYGY
jgi:hypothetical protein